MSLILRSVTCHKCKVTTARLSGLLSPCDSCQVLSPVSLSAGFPHFIFLHETFWTSLSISILHSLWSLWVCFHLDCYGIDSLIFRHLLIVYSLNFLGVNLMLLLPEYVPPMFQPYSWRGPFDPSLTLVVISILWSIQFCLQEVTSMLPLKNTLRVPYLTQSSQALRWLSRLSSCYRPRHRKLTDLPRSCTCSPLPLSCHLAPLSTAFLTQKSVEYPIGDLPPMVTWPVSSHGRIMTRARVRLGTLC